MNVHVDTLEGRATICGDVIYDFNDQIVNPYGEISSNEPRTTGNHGVSKREEKAAIKKLLSSSRFLLPVHDKPAGSSMAGGRAPGHGSPRADRADPPGPELVSGVSGAVSPPSRGRWQARSA
jgi:hypothetical protein